MRWHQGTRARADDALYGPGSCGLCLKQSNGSMARQARARFSSARFRTAYVLAQCLRSLLHISVQIASGYVQIRQPFRPDAYPRTQRGRLPQRAADCPPRRLCVLPGIDQYADCFMGQLPLRRDTTARKMSLRVMTPISFSPSMTTNRLRDRSFKKSPAT